LLITRQVPIGRWHEIIGDPTLGDAILDRVIHRSHRIELKGESLRKRQALAAVASEPHRIALYARMQQFSLALLHADLPWG
jgi:hypothetical protein